MLEKRTFPAVNDEVIASALTIHSRYENKLMDHNYQGSRFALQPLSYKKGSGKVLIYAPYAVDHTVNEVVQNSYLIGSVVHAITNCHFYFRKRASKNHSEKWLNNHVNQLVETEQLQTIIEIGKPLEPAQQRLAITIKGNQSSNLSIYQKLIRSIWEQNDFDLHTEIHNTELVNVQKFMKITVHLPNSFNQDTNDNGSVHKLLTAFIAMTFACQQSDVFSNKPMKTVKLSTNTRLTGIFPHNRVDLHPKLIEVLGVVENEYISLWNPKNGRSRRCIVKANSRFTQLHNIQIGLSTKQKLEITNGEANTLLIQKYPCTSFRKIGLMNVNSIKEGNIIVSKDIYDSFDHHCSMFELVNTVTGASFDIQRSNITSNPNLDDGTVRLNFLQRQFIDYELPPDILSDYYYERFYNDSKADDKIHYVLKHYENGNAVPFFPYIERQALIAALQQVGYTDAKLYPLYDYSVKREKHSLIKRTKNWIAEKMIRQATLQLKVIRPYSTDEASNIVRMSSHSLKLLGLEETDTIVLKNRATEVKVRVLAMDSVDLARETNIIPSESSLNISIGIPAPIRSELGLKNVGKVIEVQRCLPYLFRKNLNLQFFSIIAAVLTTMSTGLSIGYMIMILCILIPISIYISFSKVRESISNE
ncbi:hypothetical protein [Alkalihalobacillus sp. BA299]|uniref:hypothetical protein n=1 Tax=Alkalihalobacillus sp. BA299 TaxID=2815938 RepID=UPI001ADA0794|nr:hypothetical protein [Alkalihalobacillus sp. BA299]